MATTQRRGRPAATTKTVPAKRAPAKKPVPFEFTTDPTTPDEFDEREVLFSVDGKEYTVLVRIPAHVALEYVFTSAEGGAGNAIVFALNYALGSESRRALLTCKSLTPDELGEIIKVVRAKFDGALADPKGQPSSD
jgi:hypothetical protein